MKEIGRLLVKKILINENVEITHSDPFINLENLMKIEILPVYMVTTLKKLEYFDARESSLFIDSSQVKKLLLDLYDLTIWYYKTFVNDHFTPPPYLLKPQNSTMMTLPTDPVIQPEVIRSEIRIDNTTAEGIWEDGIENAHFFEFEAGETYLGQISNGMKCGIGVYRWSDGSKYEGQWHNDSEYGVGLKEYANGDCYRGVWKDGLFHGQGVYKWKDGTLHEGSWQDNLEHGYGIKTYKDGSVQKGFWTRGELIFTEDQLGGSKPSADRQNVRKFIGD